MDLEEKLDEFQQKFVDLEQESEPGSARRHAYNQMVSWISSSQHRTPATQRAFETQIALVKLAQTLDPPNERHVVWDAVKELERIAELPPLRHVG